MSEIQIPNLWFVSLCSSRSESDELLLLGVRKQCMIVKDLKSSLIFLFINNFEILPEKNLVGIKKNVLIVRKYVEK